MTPQQLIDRFDNVITDLESNELGKLMVYAAQDSLAIIRGRIMEKGEDADGQKYKPYSTKPMLASKDSMNVGAYNNIAGSKEKRAALKWVTLDRGGKKIAMFEIPGGYKQYREIHGRQTGFVDFSFSNRMWQNIRVVSGPTEHNSGIARIAATTPEDKEKLAGNTKRRGDILKLSRSEIMYLSERFNMGIEQIFRKNGL